MDELLQEFLIESAENLEVVAARLLEFESDPSNRDAVADIFRLLHTIKGACGFLDLPRLEKLAHAAEALMGRVRDDGAATPQTVGLALESVDRVRDALAAIQKLGAEPPDFDAGFIARLEAAARAPATTIATGATPANDPAGANAGPEESADAGAILRSDAAGIRVSLDSIERIMGLVSELVLTRNQLLEVTRHRPDATVVGPLQRLSTLTSDLQDGVMRARMQPVGRVFAKLPRLVRDLGAELGKTIRLSVEGAETELDRQLLDVLSDPLTHLVRNCADHGLEGAGERIAAGKPAAGRISVRARHEAGCIVVSVEDDGRGLDAAKIRATAAARGLASEDDLAAASDQEIYRYIFAPGFSTAKAVTNISGRGVGMDVVLHKVTRAGGLVDVTSEPRKGARFTLRLPLTLAIAPALIVRCADIRFALPQQSVVEAISTHKSEGGDTRLRRSGGALFAELRGAIIPVVDLRQALRLRQVEDVLAFHGLIVVIATARATFGLLVDAVADVQEIVVKPVGRAILATGAYAGATILGDGAAVLILDPNGLAERAAVESFGEETQTRESAPVEAATALLLFRTGAGLQKALPLSLVSRIIMARARDLAAFDGGLALPHEGRLMPIAALADVRDDPAREEWPVLISCIGGETVGLLISDIMDMVHERLDVDMARLGDAPDGVIGSCLVRGAPTEVLDLGVFFERTRPQALQRRSTRKPRVLLASDGDFFTELLRPLLAAAGYDATPAIGPRDALSLTREGATFDAALIDLAMMEMDGPALARALREDADFSAPIIGLTERDAPPLANDDADLFDAFACKAERRAATQALDACLRRPKATPARASVLRKEFVA